MSPLRVLILGGTSEASALARRLAGDPRFAATLSLAGRTSHPRPQPIPVRVGGYGGAAGLASHLLAQGVDALVDATHPFAVRISRSAVEAAASAGIRLLALRRPPWTQRRGDRWIGVPDLAAAAAALGPLPRRVFLAVGRQELAPFAALPAHRYLIRSVDPPPPGTLPPGATLITGRGPFDEAAERRLLAAHRIEVLVAKNAGGVAYAKLAAARALGLPVLMVARPSLPEAAAVADAGAAHAWLAARHAGRLA